MDLDYVDGCRACTRLERIDDVVSLEWLEPVRTRKFRTMTSRRYARRLQKSLALRIMMTHSHLREELGMYFRSARQEDAHLWDQETLVWTRIAF
jgi:hypothetical protein